VKRSGCIVSALLTALGLTLALSGCLVPTVDLGVMANPARLNEAQTIISPPLWKIPLGPTLVEEMHVLSTQKLLIGLRKYDLKLSNLDYLLVDTASGAVLWRYQRDKRPGEYHLLHLSADLILFQLLQPKGTAALLAIDARSGAEAWCREFKTKPFHLETVAGSGLILSLGEHGGKISLSALDLSTGVVKWQRQVSAATRRAKLEATADEFFLITDSIERFEPQTGDILWRRGDIQLGAEGHSPIIVDNGLIIHASQGKLHQLDVGTGKSVAILDLDPGITITNISLSKNHIYLLGQKNNPDLLMKKPFLITAINRSSGKILWTYAGDLPAVSNFLEKDGRLYFGTANTLVSLDVQSGRPYFVTAVTNINRPYPVYLKMYDSTIAYIGELNIAGFDPLTGRTRYNQGITPLSQVMSLTGVDAAIKRMEERVNKNTEKQKGSKFSWSDFYSSQSVSNQKMADQWFRSSLNRSNPNRDLDFKMSRMASERSKQLAFQAFQASLDELGQEFIRHLKELADAGTLNRLKLIQKSILSAYRRAEEGDYAYRPVDKSSLACLMIIHLPTGKQQTIPLSAQYAEYGLWNIVDFEKNLVFHQGIGLNPSDYQYSEPFYNYSLARVRMYESYLFAQPVDLQKQ
jgi:outer membrane protein assembly factor BamB